MNSSNLKNFYLLILLVVLMVGVFGYYVISSFSGDTLYTDLSKFVEN